MVGYQASYIDVICDQYQKMFLNGVVSNLNVYGKPNKKYHVPAIWPSCYLILHSMQYQDYLVLIL
jgi:hypothetical protein